MRNFAIIILFALVLVFMVLAGIYLRDNRILFGPKASSPSGVVLIGVTPASLSANADSEFTLTLTLDTKGASISGLQAVLYYPSDSADFQLVSIDLDPAMSSGGWTKAFGRQDQSGNEQRISLGAYVNGSWTSSGKVNFATIKLKSTSNTTKTIKFDESLTKATSGPDSVDILFTPSETAAVTVGTTTPPPSSNSHKVCINNSCAVIAGSGTDQCTTVGASCNGTFSQTAAQECNGKYDPNCFNCVDDDQVNILDFSCFKHSYGLKRNSGTVKWQ